jgi:hypothetical protein
MTLRVVGAGLGRTGTHSLQLALQQLLGGPCYHMMDVFGRPDDIPVWHAAAEGTMPDWEMFLSEYRATVDWPAAAFWRELRETSPDAVVLLSTRADADAWWKSARDTIFEVSARPVVDDPVFGAQQRMIHAVLENRFTPEWQDAGAAKAAYEAHNDAVRAAVPADRLIDWRPADGWEPICAALDLPVPEEPFPHVNTTSDFRALIGLDAATPE